MSEFKSPGGRDTKMAYSEKREYKRYDLEGTIELEFLKNLQRGKVINTSFGGIFVEMEERYIRIEIGGTSKIQIFDIFSDRKCEFESKTVRIEGSKIAFKFINPLNEYQRFFLEQWIQMFESPLPEE
ncbi:MAG: PilZ domain-containing protein [Nitrospinota bacterium]